MSGKPTKHRPETFTDVINLWSSLTALAADCGVALTNVQQWKLRDNIPSKFWNRVVASARKRHYPVSLKLLAELAAQKAPPMIEGSEHGAQA